MEAWVQQGIRRFGQRVIAKAARMSLREVIRAVREPAKLRMAQLKGLIMCLPLSLGR
jgi:hypothetical protein